MLGIYQQYREYQVPNSMWMISRGYDKILLIHVTCMGDVLIAMPQYGGLVT